uniref:C2H2-type domain-containing protein n=1 Tax=Anopheles melas TaxID=34690 RepID=A0A182TYM9_9DIPT
LQDGFYHLFAEPDESLSRAKILGDILDIELTPELCHSQIICVNCNMQCLEYHSLVQRMEAIRTKLTMTYNQTVMKLTGLTEKDLKEGLVAVEDGGNMENDLQTFNKDFLSMEDMFGDMEALNPDDIHLNSSSEQLDSELPKLGIEWETITESNEGSMPSISLIRPTAVLGEETPHPVGHVKEELFTTPSEESEQLQPIDSALMEENAPEASLVGKLEQATSKLLPIDTDDTQTVGQELSEDETLHRFMLESNETIVEVAGEDGTSIYCVYNDVIETLSDTEEQSETVTKALESANAGSLLEYDDVIVDSASQISAHEAYEIGESTSSPSLMLENANVARSRSPSPSQLEEPLQPEDTPADWRLLRFEPIERGFGCRCVPMKTISSASSIQIGIIITYIGIDLYSSFRQMFYVKVGTDYYCTVCSTDDPVKADCLKSMAHHLAEEHGQQTHLCELCDVIFFQKQSYVAHLAEHSASDDQEMEAGVPLSCNVCSETFTSKRALELHRKMHPRTSHVTNKIWSCEVCNKKYTSKAFYEVHMNKHAGLRPYKCDLCAKDFSSKYALAVHQKTHNERPRTFVCNECGNSFYSRHNLVQHERTHRAVREYECAVCRKKFFTQHNLNVHMVIHSADKAFACRECGKKFARKAELLDHERIHTGEKPFACDMCDASFAQRSNLHSHRRMTHLNDKRFKCDRCDAAFKRRRLLTYHIRAMHTGERPYKCDPHLNDKRFKCDRCDAAFKRRRLLTYHIRAMHTGERPYKCDLCHATFVYPEHFQKHKRIHTGIKPYACEVCHRTFTSQDNRNAASQDNRNAHRYVHSDKKPFECVTCGAGFMRKSHLYTHMQEVGHLSDTIVVNQPRISANRTLEFETDTYVTDGTGEGEQGQEMEGSDEENVQLTYICDDDNVDGELEAD